MNTPHEANIKTSWFTPFTVIGRPTQAQVIAFGFQLRDDLTQIPNNHSPNHGYLRIRFPLTAAGDASYLADTGEAYPFPPAPAPDRPAGVAAGQAWDLQKEHWIAFQKIRTSAKQYALPIWGTALVGLEDPVTRLTNVHIPEILTHLTRTYANPGRPALKANEQSMFQPYVPQDESIEDFFKRMQQGQLFASLGNPIATPRLITEILNLFSALDHDAFNDAITIWDDAQRTDPQDWPHFMAEFTQAYTKWEEQEKTNPPASSTGHGANAALQISPDGSTITFNDITVSYCWSHGLSLLSNGHSSKSCNNKAPNHVASATLFNMCGGCRRVKAPGRVTWINPYQPRETSDS